jgi:hypothetical protein
MLDFLAPLFGRQVVYLRDFDGEITKRWARATPFGLLCWRYRWFRQVCLLPDGTVTGAEYVHEWKPAHEA